jgi:hypothetical protein
LYRVELYLLYALLEAALHRHKIQISLAIPTVK